jgi:predicted nucleic acid-binding protein
MRIIVADAGPLIALSRIGRLEILRRLFREVVIPDVVAGELRLHERRPGIESLASAVFGERWIVVRETGAFDPIAGLDDGESAAILLSGRMRLPLLVDERRARAAALARGIPVIGIGRILVEARRRKLIDSVAHELTALHRCGYRMSDALRGAILSLAGEDGRSGR